jgi:hypothetical protein
MSLSREFENIDILLRNSTETTGVDCFSLAVIKLERQMRRLFTYSIFQFSCFSDSDIPALRKALVDQKRTYFEGFIRGMDAIHPHSIAQFVGAEYPRLFQVVNEAADYRNKIFHGQLTPKALGTAELLSIVESIRSWCQRLGDSAENYLGYSGFTSSFRKAADPAFLSGYRINLSNIQDYEAFLTKNVKRP